MKISFPYMGTVMIYKKILELLGHDVLVPPRPSRNTLDLGVKHSPEFACFPFKTIMGTYIEACEMGADTLITSGGHGPCRAGFYGEIHRKILNKMNYDLEFIVFDSYFRDKKAFMNNIKKLKGHNSWLKVAGAILFTYKLLKEVDKFDRWIAKHRPYEKIPGSMNHAWDEIQIQFEKAHTRKGLKTAIHDSQAIISAIPLEKISEEKRIKIGIVGEIYVVMESSINMEIEKMLGELGCEVERSQYLSDWVDYHMVPNFLKKSHEEEILKKGEEFIEIEIGGHAKQTVGHIINFKEKGFDGIIHLMPFGCLPELISQSVLPKVSKKYDIPVLTLSLDEQTGQANNRTRIEAFIDLIRNKKYGKQYSA